MTHGPVDESFLRGVEALRDAGATTSVSSDEERRLLDYFRAQALSRHTDFALRELQSRGEAFYTIGSSGHESDAAIALASRPSDPALLHYRSGGFYAARASQVPGVSAADDILSGAMSSTADGISGGRHKVFGSSRLNVIPQTSTIASHLPRAVGLAGALGWLSDGTIATGYPDDAIVICSFGDASLNHSTAQGALNAAAYCCHRGLDLPVLFVCEDNGIGISTKSPPGWVASRLSSFPGLSYRLASGQSPLALLEAAAEVVADVRRARTPALLHLETVRLMGHAGSDAEIAYRSPREITADYARDPLLATASTLVSTGTSTPAEVVELYEETRRHVAERAALVPRTHLTSAAAVTAPIDHPRSRPPAAEPAAASDRAALFRGALPETQPAMTLAQSINAALKDALLVHPEALVFGEDVARKGGVYGVTRGLLRAFGPARIFDTLLDEQTILGTALGTALAGRLPIPEIQYLAYLHNAEDQLRGEAATLAFFSDGQYRNGMVVRIAGLAYQRGFGGHFHNDNSVAVLRDIPGVVLAVASTPDAAPRLLRTCLALARDQGRVCVFLEPIALYHERDVLDGDGAWLAAYPPPAGDGLGGSPFRTRTVHEGADLLLITFGNGVRLSLRAADALARQGIECEVLDLQWLSPLPIQDLCDRAHTHERVLVVDETRRSGGVSESVLTALLESGYRKPTARVTSIDSFIPLGPAATHVLLSVEDVVSAAVALAGDPAHPDPRRAVETEPKGRSCFDNLDEKRRTR
jgi:2-oxoisovalerate dehydrogenase E1 component